MSYAPSGSNRNKPINPPTNQPTMLIFKKYNFLAVEENSNELKWASHKFGSPLLVCFRFVLKIRKFPISCI
jgi:hypothetical protein